MKRLFANLMVLGVLGVSTAAIAQDAQDHRRDALEQRRDRIDQRQNADAARANRIDQRQDAMAGRRNGIIANQRWGQYNRNVVAQQRFRAGFWRAPPGYAYRRWNYGETLPGLYFSQNYWLTNWAAYGLFAPPSGLVWVRYGPDVMLVDRYTGQIVQVRYGLFY